MSHPAEELLAQYQDALQLAQGALNDIIKILARPTEETPS